jgi:putative ABC transport system permease protein
MGTLLEDLRYGFRMLRKNPGFAAVAVVTLALGIGANTAIFSIVHAVLLRPLSYQDPARLVMVWEQNPHRGWSENIVSGANFLDWKRLNHVFDGLAAFESSFFNLSGDATPEEISGERVSTNLFSVLGVQPFRGRLFLADEEQREKAAVLVSYGLWQQRYGGDPALVGKRISLNGESYPVVGILPATFDDAIAKASLAPHPQLWISGIEPFEQGREFHNYHVIARLRHGITLEQAQAEMDTIARRIELQYPESRGWGVALVRLHDQVVEYSRPALLVLLGAVGLVLLIACANVANLFLVRVADREKETAVRTALGASRAGIVRQFLVESMLLSIFGATAGVAVAAWGSEILIRLFPDTSLGEGTGINAQVLLFALAVALASGILFGLVPALTASKPNVHESLKEGGRSSSGGRKNRRLRDFLVVAEFGLALALLAAAGLMIKALAHLHRVELGFNPENLVSLKVPLEGPQYSAPQRQVEFFQRLLGRLEALPNVEAASISRGVPIGDWAGWSFVTADNPNPAAGEVPDANYVVIGPHYFRTLQIPLLRGRPFTDADRPGSQPVVIVSESLASKYWPGQDPIGKRLKPSSDANDKSLPWFTVVGVAGNVRSRGQYAPFVPEMYLPYTQYPWVLWPRHILVRSAGDPRAITSAIRREVAALDKGVPVSDVATMQEIVAGPVRQGQAITWLLGGFAVLALALAAVGIYSVISYAVWQRTREIGIRVALGASHGNVTRLVVRQSLLLAVMGVAAGLLGALAITSFFATLPFQMRWLLLFDVRPTDPLLFAAVSAMLVLVALSASYLPARRAARVDPMVALRYE